MSPFIVSVILYLLHLHKVHVRDARTHIHTHPIWVSVDNFSSQYSPSTGWVPGIHPVQLGSKQLYPFSLVQNELLMEAAEFKKPPGIIFPYFPTHVLGSEIRDASLGLIPH